MAALFSVSACWQALASDPLSVTKPQAASFSLGAHGELVPQAAGTRSGPVLWSATNGYDLFYDVADGGILDWGDAAGNTIGAFKIAYCSYGASTLDVQILFLGNENGGPSAHANTFLGGFNLLGLPGGSEESVACWLITVDLTANPNYPFVLTGPDLDIADGKSPNFPGVGLSDFGYVYGQLTPQAAVFGPFVAVDDKDAPGFGSAPGIEDAFDVSDSEGNVDELNLGGWPANPFAQTYLEIAGIGTGGCPNDPTSKCEHSDIFPAGGGDCQVNLSDLGVVLSNYAPGVPGKTRDQGDIFPFGGGNGVVDLSDLGQVLADFGSDCR